MSLLLQVAGSATRAWSHVYTSGLDPEARQRRLAEIESDLYEHAEDAKACGVAAADVGFDILVRLVVGVPADLAWRRGAARDRRVNRRAVFSSQKGKRIVAKLFIALTSVLAVALGGFLMVEGIARLFVTGDAETHFVYPITFTVAGAALIASVVVARKSPRKGAGLVALAAVTYTAASFWMAPFVIPVAALLLAGAWLRARRDDGAPAAAA